MIDTKMYVLAHGREENAGGFNRELEMAVCRGESVFHCCSYGIRRFRVVIYLV